MIPSSARPIFELLKFVAFTHTSLSGVGSGFVIWKDA